MKLWSERPGKKSIRGLEYNADGSGMVLCVDCKSVQYGKICSTSLPLEVLYSISKDKSITAIDAAVGTTKIKLPSAHE